MQLAQRLDQLIKKLDLDSKKIKLQKLEQQTLDPNFWANDQQARVITQEMAHIKDTIEKLESLKTRIKDIHEFEMLSHSEDDQKDIQKEIQQINNDLKELETQAFLSGPYDQNHAILSIHSGQGGTEAMDWAAMLQRMYLKYFESKGYKFQLLSETPGEEAGIKSATFLIETPMAYGFLKTEAGTHRLVRQSPFNADNLRQTSFALVEVMPVLEKLDEIKIKDEDIQFQAFRSSGKGGQNVNKVSTAVRLKHLPTGITVECQTQRFQAQNRKMALNLLLAKLWQLEEAKRESQKQAIKGDHKIAGWGNQIRSYVLHPYKQVKDLRTRLESKQPQKVLDGDLEPFIQARLRQTT